MPFTKSLLFCILVPVLLGACAEEDPVVKSNTLSNLELSSEIVIVSSNNREVDISARFNTASERAVKLDSANDQVVSSRKHPLGYDFVQQQGGVFAAAQEYVATRQVMQEQDAYLDPWLELFDLLLLFDRDDAVYYGKPSYHAYLGPIAADDVFYVELYRSTRNQVLSSSATLPEAFTMIEPATAMHQPRTTALQLSWSPAGLGDALTLTLSADCGEQGPFNLEQVIADSGSYSVDLSLLIPEHITLDQECSMVVGLNRSRDGQLAAEYGLGGSIKAIQRRTRVVTLDP